jgi:hypothetical protein
MKLEPDEEEDVEEETDEGDDAVDEVSTDNIGDPSVEINVEDLIHELESQGLVNRLGNEIAARRRLEELMEQKRSRRDLEDFEDYDI